MGYLQIFRGDDSPLTDLHFSERDKQELHNFAEQCCSDTGQPLLKQTSEREFLVLSEYDKAYIGEPGEGKFCDLTNGTLPSGVELIGFEDPNKRIFAEDGKLVLRDLTVGPFPVLENNIPTNIDQGNDSA